jgi:hypothetical protein
VGGSLRLNFASGAAKSTAASVLVSIEGKELDTIGFLRRIQKMGKNITGHREVVDVDCPEINPEIRQSTYSKLDRTKKFRIPPIIMKSIFFPSAVNQFQIELIQIARRL